MPSGRKGAGPKLALVHGFAPADDVAALARAKLEESGLTVDDAKRLGISWHTPEETRALCSSFWGLPSLKIPYHDPRSGAPASSAPKWPSFYRVRALRAPAPLPDDFKKYLQAPDTGVCAYFPRLIDWKPIISDYKRELVITEGELKAAKATADGFPTIGLGGVNSFGSSVLGIDLLPALEAFEWPRRRVTIIYDSDLQSNANVCRALNELADRLAERGALPSMLLLPPIDGLAKTGLDDFLVLNHPDVLREMIRTDAVQLTAARPLWSLNETYAYVPSLDRVVRRGEVYLSSPASFRTASTARYAERILRDDGNLSTRRVSAAESWLSWPLRGDARSLTYSPSQAPLDLIPSRQAPLHGAPDVDYNTWTGWGVEPKKGNYQPFLDVVNHLFTGSPPGVVKWFLQWCAYPLQHPGVKMFSSVVIHGLHQGTGKSLIGYTLGKIYGKNFTEIKQDDIHNGFNEWAIGKQLIMGDDVTGSDRRQDLDLLKKLITQKELRVNAKNQPTYLIPDCINYLWTSNQPDAFFLEDNDRRFFIQEVRVEPLPEEFYIDYDRRLNKDADNALAAATFHFLLNLDLEGFNPFARALGTESKNQMMRAARSDLANWVRDVVMDPEAYLTFGGVSMIGDMFTNRQLIAAYCNVSNIDPEKISAKRMWAELARAGIRQVNGGQPVRVEGAGVDRYYAIRRVDKWLRADHSEIAKHLEPPIPKDPPNPRMPQRGAKPPKVSKF